MVKVADMHWRPSEKRLVRRGSTASTGKARQSDHPEYRRRRAALRFERVLSCKCRNCEPGRKDGILNLLTVEFAETDAPAGVVTLIFSGGAALRLEVECLEAELADLGPTWSACACPAHRARIEAQIRAAPSARLAPSRPTADAPDVGRGRVDARGRHPQLTCCPALR